MRARELLIMMRVQNQASGELRRISRDLGSLQTRAQLVNRIKTAELSGASIRTNREALRTEKESLETGAKRVAQQERYNAAITRTQTLQKNLNTLSRNLRRNETATIEAEERALKLQAQARPNGPRPPSGVTRASAARLANAALTDAATLRRAQYDMINASNLHVSALSKEIRGMRELEAAEVAMSQRAGLLGAKIQTQSDALDLNTKKVRALKQELAAFRWQNIEQGAQIFSHVGRVVQLFGLLTTAALGAAAVAAGHFATQATLAATQTGKITDSPEQIARNSVKIQKAVQDQMTKFPATGEEMNKTLYDIYSSMNVSFGGGVKLLKLFNQGAVAGGAKLEDVATAMITVGNNFKISGNNVKEWQKLMASTMATVRFGFITLQEYTQTQNQLANSFRRAHQPILQMNAAIATTTRLLHNPRMAATGLARLMEVLQNPKLIEGLKKNLNIDIAPKGNLRNLSEVLKMIREADPEILKSGVALDNFFKKFSDQRATVQARRVFGILIQHPQLYAQILRKVNGDQEEFNRSLHAMEKTAGVTWPVFINQLKVLALQFGAAAIPAFQKLGKVVQAVSNFFIKLPPEVKSVISTFLVFAAVGALVGGTLLSLVGGITTFVIYARTLRGFMTSLKAPMEEVAASSIVLAGGTGRAGIEMRGLAESAGMANPFFAAFIGTVLVGLPLLNHFVGTAKILTTSLRLLSIAFSVMLARSLAVGALKMVAARLAMEGLATTAAALAGIGTIQIILSVVVAAGTYKAIDEFLNLTHGGRELKKDLRKGGEVVFDFWHRDIADVNKGLTGLHGNALKIQRLVAQIFSKNILPTKVQQGNAKEKLKKMFPELTEKDIEIFFNAALAHARRKIAEFDSLKHPGGFIPGVTDFGKAGVPKVAHTPIVQQEDLLSDARRIERLRELAQNASTPNIDAYRRWTDAKKAYDKQWGEAAKSLIQDVGLVTDKQAKAMELRLKRLQVAAAVNPTKANFDAVFKAQADIDAQLNDKQKSTFGQMAENIKVVTDAQAVQLQRTANKLKAAFEVAPSVSNWKRWSQSQKAITAKLTEDQKQMAQDIIDASGSNVLSDRQVVDAQNRINALKRTAESAPSIDNWRKVTLAIEDLGKKASSVQQQIAEGVIANTPVVSDRQFVQMSMNVERLKTRLSEAPSPASWNAYYSAVNQLDAVTRSHQQQTLSEFTSALNQTVANARSKMQELISTVQGMYNTLLERNKAAFGQLFSGPYVKSIDSRISAITNSAHSQAEKIRKAAQDQADAIRKTAKDTKQAVEDTDSEIAPAAQKFLDGLRNEREQMVFAIINAGKEIDPSVTEYLNNLNTNINRLEDAVKGVKGLDPIMGNLVDWGLLPKPGELDKATTKANDLLDTQADNLINAANDRADAIEAAAAKKAAALQNKLDTKDFSPKEMLDDLRKQRIAFTQWNRDLATLGKRGAPPELIKQLRDLGPEYAKAIHNLAKAPKGAWQAYLVEFKKGQKIIKAQTMADLKTELKQYKSHGKMLAQALIAGMNSEDRQITSAIQRLITKMFPELASTAKGNVKKQLAGLSKTAPVATSKAATKKTTIKVAKTAKKAAPRVLAKVSKTATGGELPIVNAAGGRALRVINANASNAKKTIKVAKSARKTASATTRKNTLPSYVGFKPHVPITTRPSKRSVVVVPRRRPKMNDVPKASTLPNYVGFKPKMPTVAKRAVQTVLRGTNKGMIAPGNINLLNRAIAKVGDKIATVHSFSIGTNKGEVLLPQVINGILVSINKAIAHYKKTGENLGTFKDVASANAYAARLHKEQAALYGKKPTAAKTRKVIKVAKTARRTTAGITRPVAAVRKSTTAMPKITVNTGTRTGAKKTIKIARGTRRAATTISKQATVARKVIKVAPRRKAVVRPKVMPNKRTYSVTRNPVAKKTIKIARRPNPTKNASRPSPPPSTPAGKSQGKGNEYTYNYNYYAGKDGNKSAETWMRQQHFRDRNKGGC